MRLPIREQRLLNEFKGLPQDRLEYDVSSSKPIDSLIEVLINRYHIEQATPEETIMSHWRELLGETNAHRCSPVRLDAQQTLHIAVSNPTLRRELMFNQRTILQRLQQLPGCDHIRAIRLVAG